MKKAAVLKRGLCVWHITMMKENGRAVKKTAAVVKNNENKPSQDGFFVFSEFHCPMVVK